MIPPNIFGKPPRHSPTQQPPGAAHQIVYRKRFPEYCFDTHSVERELELITQAPADDHKWNVFGPGIRPYLPEQSITALTRVHDVGRDQIRRLAGNRRDGVIMTGRVARLTPSGVYQRLPYDLFSGVIVVNYEE
jgi:hypothetical protein